MVTKPGVVNLEPFRPDTKLDTKKVTNRLVSAGNNYA